jgi:hypothetical protein
MICFRLAAFYQPVAEQEHDGAENGDSETAKIEAGDITVSELNGDKSTDKGADDPEYGGDDGPSRIIPRHQELGERPDDEAKYDP